MSAYTKPLPVLTGENAPFWQAAHRHELHAQRCVDCGTLRFPASRFCPACYGGRSEWSRLTGRGVVETFCIFHKPYFESFKGEVPYNVVLIRLAEGLTLFSNVIGIADAELRIGLEVEAVFVDVTPDVSLVKFRPIN